MWHLQLHINAHFFPMLIAIGYRWHTPFLDKPCFLFQFFSYSRRCPSGHVSEDLRIILGLMIWSVGIRAEMRVHAIMGWGFHWAHFLDVLALKYEGWTCWTWTYLDHLGPHGCFGLEFSPCIGQDRFPLVYHIYIHLSPQILSDVWWKFIESRVSMNQLGTPRCNNIHNPTIPRCSMYRIFTNICPKNDPNVGKYSIRGASGICNWWLFENRLPMGTLRCDGMHLKSTGNPWSFPYSCCLPTQKNTVSLFVHITMTK